ncbi:RDD family protein [Roseicyclus persicicus]|uniref:RDD family protein n=1 Tax=Roseicyclus persicicus TaxID=2650661 RepID=A0A7X6JXQ5_9RHOB|nr:RDD family protein [Roseibacterium persicicum]NKX45792.1 RDD family protein [Roseibacterium persicicum]
MTAAMIHGLPDPDYDRAFYDGVPAKRLFAWLVDVVITVVITFLLGLFTLSLLWWVWPVTFVVASFLYRAGTIAAGSATLGMRLMNLELRGPTGHRLTPGEAVLHTLGYMVATGFVIVQLVSIWMMAFGRRHQGLHDLVLGSVAINRPR